MSRIVWKIGKASGMGEPIPTCLASEWVRYLNRKYGPNTHSLEDVL